MKKVIILNKKEGETPLEAIERFRASRPSYKKIKMTYAGRLDPMASGAMIILAGEEVHNKPSYLSLDKEYEFEILFGFTTDTFDILGELVSSDFHEYKQKDIENLIKKNLKFFRGKFIQKYPMYSSRTLNGKPLFEYARSGMNVEPPEKEVVVKGLSFSGLRMVSKKALLKNVERRIAKVGGDFRQAKILKIWQKAVLGHPMSKYFFVGDFKIKCSSGTYVRGVANGLGERIGIPALAFSIKRTKIGRYGI